MAMLSAMRESQQSQDGDSFLRKVLLRHVDANGKASGVLLVHK